MEHLVMLALLASLVLGTAATEWVLRRTVMAQVRRQMMTDAQAAAEPPPTAQAKVAAAGRPRLRRILTAEMPIEAYETERRWLVHGVALIRRLLWTDLGFALACLLLLALPAALGATQAQWGLALVAGVLGLLSAVAALARYSVSLERFDLPDELFMPMPWDPWWRRALKRCVLALAVLLLLAVAVPLIIMGVAVWPLLWLLRRVAGELAEALVTQLQTTLSVVLLLLVTLMALVVAGGAFEANAWMRAAAGVLVMWSIHRGWHLLWQARALRHERGHALLVLRVFDQLGASDFTFNRLMRHWRFFGPHFTVVDGSLVQASGRHGLRWPGRLGVFALLMVGSAVAGATLQGTGAPGWLVWPVSAVLSTGVACGLLWLYVRWRVARRFVRSRAQLLARLARLDQRPRNLDLSYRHERALCHNDTWKMAVAEFARRADMVLMDLRGLQAHNKGCEEEMEFLFDTVPAARIVFLVDDRDPAALDARLARRWAMQSPSSPNVHVAHPELTLYVAGGLALEALDLSGLARTLMWRLEAATAA